MPHRSFSTATLNRCEKSEKNSSLLGASEDPYTRWRPIHRSNEPHVTTKNGLKIRAKDLHLDLEGESEYVERAYAAIRTVLMERYRESLEITLGDEPSDVRSRQTLPLHTVSKSDADADLNQHVNVVICNEVYNKIHLANTDDLEASPFSRVIDFDSVRRIYLNRSQSGHFEKFVPVGKTLWRELTSAGRAAVKGES